MDLLQKRYLVIADYPDMTLKNSWKIGDILDRDWARFPYDNELYPPIWKISDYPHLFRELHWWEMREEKDMPEYVKEFGKQINEVAKVTGWSGCYSVVEMGEFEGLTKYWLPATLQEYDDYIKNNSK